MATRIDRIKAGVSASSPTDASVVWGTFPHGMYAAYSVLFREQFIRMIRRRGPSTS